MASPESRFSKPVLIPAPENRFSKPVLVPVEEDSFKERGKRKKGAVASAFLAGALVIATCSGPTETVDFEIPSVPDQKVVAMQELPAIYDLKPKPLDKFYNPTATRKAVEFIRMLQPENTYILTAQGENDVVHMDVAHSAIALSKVEGYLPYAENAVDWLLERVTKPGDQDAEVIRIENGKPVVLNYAGSLYDHYDIKGNPKKNLPRARGEGLAMTLIAIYSIYQQKPEYLDKEINGQQVIDYVEQISQFLISLQNENGTFNHDPIDKESFDEEVARDVLGLKLSGEMLGSKGKIRESTIVEKSSQEGLDALNKKIGLKKGMPYDRYARAIWGLGNRNVYKRELTKTREAGLVTDSGVLNWDRQAKISLDLSNLDETLNGLKYWLQSDFSYSPAPDIDWGIASIMAGDINEALKVESREAGSQDENGGIPAVTIRYINWGVGAPASYSAARLILFENQLAEAISLN